MSASTSNPQLRLLHKFRANEPAIATFMMLPSARMGQVLASTGVDVSSYIPKADMQSVVIDCEHGNIGDSDMHDAVMGVASQGCSPVVRIRGPSGPLIKRALDSGAHGLLVPLVNTAKEAEDVVRFSKFPPVGVRGQGSPFAGFAQGMTTPEYVKSANDNVQIMVQIESPEGLANVEDICKVDGVDVIFIGPNDLALSTLGYVPARGDEPSYKAAIDTIVKTAKANGKKTGILVNNGALAKAAKDRFDFIIISGDVKALGFWFADQMKAAQ